MREEKKNNLTIIEGAKQINHTETPVEIASHQTNPIQKDLIKFWKEKKPSFSVRDLFRK